MSDKNIEMLNKIIEDKKRKSAEQKNDKKADKVIGKSRKGIRQYRKGGVFDN